MRLTNAKFFAVALILISADARAQVAGSEAATARNLTYVANARVIGSPSEDQLRIRTDSGDVLLRVPPGGPSTAGLRHGSPVIVRNPVLGGDRRHSQRASA